MYVSSYSLFQVLDSDPTLRLVVRQRIYNLLEASDAEGFLFESKFDPKVTKAD